MKLRTLAFWGLLLLAGAGLYERRLRAERVRSSVDGAAPKRKGRAHAGHTKRRAPHAHATARTLAAGSPFSSRQACLQGVAAGERLARAPGKARLASWNLHWFPDGRPGKRASEHPTDIVWLACAMAYLDADVFALQEVKAHARGRSELDRLASELRRLTGREWEAQLDDCEPAPAQHVALLWSHRVEASDFSTLGSLNPLSSPCENHLRPGFAARFRFPGGLDLEVVSVHLKSGGERRSLSLRERSIDRFADVLADVDRRYQDGDLVLIGDYNVMGCPHCSPKLDEHAEQQALAARLSGMPRPFTALAPHPQCSQYFSGRGTLLDLAVAPRAMQELGPQPEVQVSGLCAELACGALPEPAPAAFHDLSDHCPITVDLLDQDLDAPDVPSRAR